MSKSAHAIQTPFERARRKADRRRPVKRRQSTRYTVIQVAIREQS